MTKLLKPSDPTHGPRGVCGVPCPTCKEEMGRYHTFFYGGTGLANQWVYWECCGVSTHQHPFHEAALREAKQMHSDAGGLRCHECSKRDPADFVNIDDHKCAFPLGVFTSDNWDCETMNKLRKLGGDPIWNDDQWSSTTPHDGEFIILGGYKRRLSVEYAGNLDQYKMEKLTLKRANTVIAHLEKTG